VCYDCETLEERKEHEPKGSALSMAAAMGIEILTEDQYRHLQTQGEFDTKTSSWEKTPLDIRSLGGAFSATAVTTTSSRTTTARSRASRREDSAPG
jgi:hypothetical protein